MSHETVSVAAVEFHGEHLVEFRFDDGVSRRRNLDPLLTGPIFESIRTNPEEFRRMAIDTEFGVVSWPNGADIDAELLRYDDLWNGTVGVAAAAG